ncbi:MAG: hypothetical protein ACUVX1_15690 [Chloroflexota bacterium]
METRTARAVKCRTCDYRASAREQGRNGRIGCCSKRRGYFFLDWERQCELYRPDDRAANAL